MYLCVVCVCLHVATGMIILNLSWALAAQHEQVGSENHIGSQIDLVSDSW